MKDFLRCVGVAVDDHGNTHALGNTPHGLIFGRAGEALRAGSAVHGEHPGAFCLKGRSQLHSVFVRLVPAGAHFDGHGNVNCLHHRADNGGCCFRALPAAKIAEKLIRECAEAGFDL